MTTKEGDVPTKKKNKVNFLSPNVLFQRAGQFAHDVVSAPFQLGSGRSDTTLTHHSNDKDVPSLFKPGVGGARHLRNIFAVPMSVLHHVVAGPDHGTAIAGAPPKDDFASLPSYKHLSTEVDFLVGSLKDHYLFESLSELDLQRFATAFEKVHFDKTGDKDDTVIIQQDDWVTAETAYFYVLYEGTCIYEVNNEMVGDPAVPGDSFGELALLYNCPRAATVKALTSISDVQLFRIHQKGFRQVLQKYGGISSDAEQEKFKLLDGIAFLRQNCTKEELDLLAKNMKPRMFEPGEHLMKQGELTTDWFVIKQGTVRITNIEVDSAANKSGISGVYSDVVLSSGESFGEFALLQQTPNRLDIIAETDGLAFTIGKDVFLSVVKDMQRAVVQAVDYKKLKGVRIIKETIQDDTNNRVLNFLVSKIKNKSFPKGTVLCHEGKPIQNPAFYFVRKGQVQLHSKQARRDDKINAEYYFGDDQLLFDAFPGSVAAYTATVTEDVTVGILPLEICRKIMNTKKIGTKQTLLFDSLRISGDGKNLSLAELDRHRVLGAGTFGQVWLVSRNGSDGTKHAYALKIQSKYELVKNGQARGVVLEKQVMAKLNHPFVGGLVASFQDDAFVYMLMPLIQGGELYSVMHVHKNHKSSEAQSVFYIAAITEGLTYMHRRGYVFRDLKPENVLVDAQGYPVIVDFGFAKFVIDKTFTLCGTPLYIAPEVILNRGHNYGADHWSLGCLIYEFLEGSTPFYESGMDQSALFKAIVKGTFHMPRSISAEAQSIIGGLLTRNPAKRLGNLSGGLDDLVYHPWLNQLDHDSLVLKEIKAPIVPNIKDPFDGSNFDDWSHAEDKAKIKYPALQESEKKLFEDF